MLAIALLHAFVQSNYTGPYLSHEPTLLLPDSLATDTPFHTRLQKQILRDLSRDGEDPYHLTPRPHYLFLALTLLDTNTSTLSFQHLATTSWWRARASFIHQRILDDPAASLHTTIFTSLTSIRPLVESHGSRDLLARHSIETGLAMTHYGNDREAFGMFEKAGKESGLEWALTGRMGRRTKFQTFDTSQLVVVAKSRDRDSGQPTAERIRDGEKIVVLDKPAQPSTGPAPKTLDLNDDTLLEAISFTSTSTTPIPNPDLRIPPSLSTTPTPPTSLPPTLHSEDPNTPSPLHPLDSTILLGLTICIKNTNPDDGITMEEMSPYAARVLAHPRNWSVHSHALLVRTRLEAGKGRTVERSALQLQALVDQLLDDVDASRHNTRSEASQAGHTSFLRRGAAGDGEDSATTRQRLGYAWQLHLPASWDLESELATRWVSLGAIKSALEIFERLEMWAEVAMCYGAIDREDKAAEVLRAQLEVNPNSAKLWTLLGDVERNPAHWETAWEVSGGRYAKAQRALGRHWFTKREYEMARDAYALSLKINPLNQPAWFTYGCIGLELGDWEIAVQAFTRCVGMDQQDGESWNNLASAFLRSVPSRKRDAFMALKQGLGAKFDSWRMWENYMLVSADVGEWGEVCRAVQRVIELRGEKIGEECLDVEVLQVLINQVVGATYPEGEEEARNRGLPRQVNDLMKNVVQPIITADPRLWKLMAKLHLWRDKPADALDAHIKAYRVWTNRPDLETEIGAWRGACAAAEDLVDAYRSLGPREGRMGGVVCKDWKFSSRSVVRTLRGRGKDSWEDTVEYERLGELVEELKNE
ncbi:TPR repeat-containing protein C19B12.01 [Saitoella complicata NRRL Y-17804]|nr:TPR repeat-containing protein C19B12.01 [Saitoella complicata NRRL Y-17804]ODQ56614.1 TPR repeat-containing protein C19B12.01 [Saitoella complicata NRRL Y-17804]